MGIISFKYFPGLLLLICGVCGLVAFVPESQNKPVEQKLLKQHYSRIVNLARKYRKGAFRFESESTGAWVLPEKKLVICSVSKAGCTSMKWIMLRLLGGDPNKFCHRKVFSDKYPSGMPLVHATETYARLSATRLRDIMPPPKKHENMSYSSEAMMLLQNWNVSEMFLSDEWLTIAQVRDPWYRR